MAEEKKTVLLIGSQPVFGRTLNRYLIDSFKLLNASDQKEGLALARSSRPDAIVLGYLDPRGTSFALHQKLRAGWITKHIPLLVVDIQDPDSPHDGWTQSEAMQMDAEDYFFVTAGQPSSESTLAGTAGILERLAGRLAQRINIFQEAVKDPSIFCKIWEQIPGRGAFEIQQERVLENVGRAADGGKIHAISVTDNPGGNPALSTELLCSAIRKVGMEPLVHLACRDKNRSELESMLYGLAAEDVRNILILSGDYTSPAAFGGRPKPVFDVDPINVIKMIGEMNVGLKHMVFNKQVTLAATDIFAGVCVSPFKAREAELIPQYYKLKKKIEAGAQFVTSQIGFDMRKYHELIQWLRLEGYDIPVLANIFLLPLGAAKLMNRNGVPGCVVTDELVERIAEEAKAEDKGREARLLRAAKMYAIAKGMGCGGVHIGGHGVSYRMVEYVVDKGEELSDNWSELLSEFDLPQENGFYLYTRNDSSGLNTETEEARSLKGRASLAYRFSRLAHVVLFNPRSVVFKMLRPFARLIDKSKGLKKLLGFFEHLGKTVLFDCMNCGDCALFDVAFLCPMSKCPKQQRNGPCGGSYDGWCEVYPSEKKCVWVRAYIRLKKYKEEHEIAENFVPPCNWDFMHTSSWLNFYLGRDHSAKRLGIPEGN